MIDPKVQASLSAALAAFARDSNFDPIVFAGRFGAVFSSEKPFMEKVAATDAIFDGEPRLEQLREVFFDLLMINFFSADAIKLEDDYLETAEWTAIEEETLDRGTELLNLLLYLNECADEEIDPELEDYLKEFLLVDDDEFQDEYSIYEPVIKNQLLMDSPLAEVKKIAQNLPEDAELKELFYPMMAYFQNPDPSEQTQSDVAENAVDKDFDMAVYELLINFK